MKSRLIFILILLTSNNALAYDHDLSINRPNFNTESFLDVNKAEFNEDLNDQWYLSENGWRISSHSLTSDLTYLNTEIKLHQPLSDYAGMRLHYQQEFLYTDRDINALDLEFDVTPFPRYPVSFSILGNFNYEKSGSDQGAAITYGKRTANFIHYSEMKIDKYYNAKVDDNSEVLNHQYIRTIETAYHWSPSLQVRLIYKDFSPADLLYNDQVTHFEHQGYEYDGFIKYKFNHNNSFKIRLKGLEIEKSISGTTNEGQQIIYDSVDLKWLARQQQDYRYSFGVRDDVFSNDIYSLSTMNSVLDYPFRTKQVYSTVNHAYSTQKEWHIGLYIGITEEPNEFNHPTVDNSRVRESKLDFAWAYHSVNKKSSVYIHVSFNLDNFSEDPGDGGGITYQSTF